MLNNDDEAHTISNSMHAQQCVMLGWPAPNHIREPYILNYSLSSMSESISEEKPGINIQI